jgi:hypothetical protein
MEVKLRDISDEVTFMGKQLNLGKIDVNKCTSEKADA